MYAMHAHSHALTCTHMHSHALTDTDELCYVSYVSYVHRAMALWCIMGGIGSKCPMFRFVSWFYMICWMIWMDVVICYWNPGEFGPLGCVQKPIPSRGQEYDETLWFNALDCQLNCHYGHCMTWQLKKWLVTKTLQKRQDRKTMQDHARHADHARPCKTMQDLRAWRGNKGLTAWHFSCFQDEPCLAQEAIECLRLPDNRKLHLDGTAQGSMFDVEMLVFDVAW